MKPDKDLTESATENLTCTDSSRYNNNRLLFGHSETCLVYEGNNTDEKQEKTEKMIRGIECKINYKGIISFTCEENQFSLNVCPKS